MLLFVVSMLLAGACGTEATAPGIGVSSASTVSEFGTDPDPEAVAVLLDSFSIGGLYTVLPRGGYSSSGTYSADLNYAESVNRHPTGIELPPGLPVRVLAEGVYAATPTARFNDFWCGRDDAPAQCAIQSYSYSVHGLVPGPGVFNPYGAETGLRVQWRRTVLFEEIYYPLHPNAQLFRGVVPAAVAGVPAELHFRRLSCCYLRPPAGEGAFETYEGSWRFGVVPDDGGRRELGIAPTIVMFGPRTDAAASSAATFKLSHVGGEPLSGIRWWFIQPASNTFNGERPAGSPPTGLASYPLGSRTAYSEIVSCAGSTECVFQSPTAGAVVAQAMLVDDTQLAGRNTGLEDEEAEIRVSCVDLSLSPPRPVTDPLAIVRGNEVECRAEASPADAIAGFKVSEWSFAADVGGFTATQAVDSDTPESFVWRGVVAVSGRVSVRGRFNGSTADASALAALSVQARNWNGVLPQGYHTPVEVGQGTGKWALDVTPDADSSLGRAHFVYDVDPVTEQPVVAPFYNDGSLVVITRGPNGGLSIFGRVPNLLTGIEIQVNLVALAKDSDFWKVQPVSPAPPACPQSVVTAASTKDKIRVHEGTTLQAGSHTARFRAAYEHFVGPAFENFIAPNNDEQASFGPLAVAVLKQLKDKADEADQFNRIRWGSGNGCNFNFNY